LKDAAQRLQKMDFLAIGGVTPLETPMDRWIFRQWLHDIWYAVAPETSRQFKFNQVGSLPGTEIETEGVTFSIHGINHWLNGTSKSSVKRFVDHLRARGSALYSEENLPGAYDFNYGKESLDHQVLDGKVIRIIPTQINPLAAIEFATSNTTGLRGRDYVKGTIRWRYFQAAHG
jgi:hypothetical protein